MFKNYISLVVFLSCICFAHAQKNKFPYAAQGLSKTQAAAHLINRFTYGAIPGQVDEAEKMGLEIWLNKQLNASFNDDSLNLKLSKIDYLHLTNEEVVKQFPRNPQVVRMAIKDGFIDKDSIGVMSKREEKARLKDYSDLKNLHPFSDLSRSFINQRFIRAIYSNNQLEEVLTGFWFNHFNVSFTKIQAAQYIPAYERDVIRPNALGNFQQLLLATAKSPAMSLFLDNFLSAAEMDSASTLSRNKNLNALILQQNSLGDTQNVKFIKQLKGKNKNRGINENYARELMELHTMGVDGGYNQQDVVNAARILTGWTIYPFDGTYSGQLKKLMSILGEDNLKSKGYFRDGDFLYFPMHHDQNEKNVLGKNFPANGGYQEGVDLMSMLAHHPNTAKFICKKLAVYFVSDNPSDKLINKMAETFLKKEGDIKSVLLTMVYDPEFWGKTAVCQKIKSPFEVVVSANRALNSDIQNPYPMFGVLEKMGQKIYHYQAPTGFPDNAAYWVNTSALLSRMNFGLDIAAQNIRGIKVDLLKLNDYHEPEDAIAALKTYANILMPGRNHEKTYQRLLPLLNDVKVSQKLGNKIGEEKKSINDSMSEETEIELEISSFKSDKNMLEHVVGIILGSPDFQRK
jgi:uncharacterized protein (DUF1800 family)